MAKKTVSEEPVTPEEVTAPLTEETPTHWGGQPTRAYRSFAVPFGGVLAESIDNPETQPEVQADGEQEEPQV